MPTIAIVGGGASGVIAAANLLRETVGRAHIILIECRRELGRGLAYSTREPDHLLNVRAGNMSAYADNPGHFLAWLKWHGPALGLSNSNADSFVPRRVYGEYLASQLGENGDDGLRLIRDECLAIAKTPSSLHLTLAAHGHLAVDKVVLATGNDLRSGTLFGVPTVSAWTPWAFDNLYPDSTVLIVGTGLTMVDVVVLLNRTAHRGKIIAISRHGLTPQEHRVVTSRVVPVTEVPFGMPISWISRWLRALVDRCEAEGLDWRSAIDGLRPHTAALWRAMSVEQRHRFVRHIRSWWDVHRHRMAPSVHSIITGLQSKGRLDIVAGRIRSAVENDGKIVVTLRHRGSEDTEQLPVDLVIDCSGLPNDISRSSNPIIRSLFAGKLAKTDPLGIGIDVTESGAVIDAEGRASEQIFAVGPIARGTFWEMIAIPDIRNHCAILAAHIASQLDF